VIRSMIRNTKPTSVKPIWDFKNQGYFEEKIYGQSAMEFAYETKLGSLITQALLKRKSVSRIYGVLQNSKKSVSKISDFISRYQIDMSEYEAAQYKSFNDFFIRKFKPGMRSFSTAPKEFCSPCEGRLLAFDHSSQDMELPIKGATLSLRTLLGESDKRSRKSTPLYSQQLEGGPLGIFRLCPVDYHRYHYPDDGETRSAYEVKGHLHSVHPKAISRNGRILQTNQRRVEIIATNNFGLLAMIEIGALFVGTIHQSHLGLKFSRGDEKGYFLFGGSCVVVLGEKGSFSWDKTLTEKTAQGFESYVQLGTTLGRAR